MAVPVRINEDNYSNLQFEADKNRRSVVAQLNFILDEHFGRSTIGASTTSTPPVTPPAETHADFLSKSRPIKTKSDAVEAVAPVKACPPRSQYES